MGQVDLVVAKEDLLPGGILPGYFRGLHNILQVPMENFLTQSYKLFANHSKKHHVL